MSFAFTRAVEVDGLPFVILKTQNGAAITDEDGDPPDVFITKDDGPQAASTYLPVYKGNGQWTIDLTAQEMDALIVGVTVTHDLGITINLTIPTNPIDIDDDTPTEDIDIVGLAASPKRVQTAEGEVEERSMNDLIKADLYLKGTQATAGPPWGMRLARTKPGSAIGGGDP